MDKEIVNNKEFYSHIQAPYSILKKFNNKDGKIYCLDIKNNRIYKTTAKKFNIFKEYYSSDMEKKLSDLIEAPFGVLRADVEAFLDGRNIELKLNQKHIKLLKDMVKCSFLRGNLALNIAEEGSITYCFYKNKNEFHEDVVRHCMNRNDMDLDLDDKEPLLIKNETEKNFVFLRSCFYFFKESIIDGIIIPINPKYAIGFIDVSKKKNLDADFINIKDEETINVFNRRALYMEIMFNSNTLISSSKEELVYLRDFYIEKNKNDELINKLNIIDKSTL